MDSEGDPLRSAFLSIIESIGSDQHIHQSTHPHNHTLDLVLTYDTELANIAVMPKNPVLSDHYLATFQLSKVCHVSPDPTFYFSHNLQPGPQMFLWMSSLLHPPVPGSPFLCFGVSPIHLCHSVYVVSPISSHVPCPLLVFPNINSHCTSPALNLLIPCSLHTPMANVSCLALHATLIISPPCSFVTLISCMFPLVLFSALIMLLAFCHLSPPRSLVRHFSIAHFLRLPSVTRCLTFLYCHLESQHLISGLYIISLHFL